MAEVYIRESKSTTPTLTKLEHDFDYWRERATTDRRRRPDASRYGDPSQRERNQRLLADREGGPVT